MFVPNQAKGDRIEPGISTLTCVRLLSQSTGRDPRANLDEPSLYKLHGMVFGNGIVI